MRSEFSSRAVFAIHLRQSLCKSRSSSKVSALQFLPPTASSSAWCTALTSLPTFLWPPRALLSRPQSESGPCFSSNSQECGSKRTLLGWDSCKLQLLHAEKDLKPRSLTLQTNNLNHWVITSKKDYICHHWQQFKRGHSTVQAPVENQSAEAVGWSLSALCISHDLRHSQHLRNWLSKEENARRHLW